MILTTHQPIFLPWPGFFYKVLYADVMVLLDEVQFPFGKSWMTRNRVKCDKGELWLSVPVWKKGRGKQLIRNVEICNETNWQKKHLRSIREQYANAPYLKNLFPGLENIYGFDQLRLLELNIQLIQFLCSSMNIKKRLISQSDLGVSGLGNDLLINICKAVGADIFATLQPVRKYLDADKFQANGIQLEFMRFISPVYPQLWGNFCSNLSALDLLLNCGPASQEILTRS